MSPHLEGEVLCRTFPVGPRWTIPPGHQSQVPQKTPPCGVHAPSYCGGPPVPADAPLGGLAPRLACYKAWLWLLQLCWWAGLASRGRSHFVGEGWRSGPRPPASVEGRDLLWGGSRPDRGRLLVWWEKGHFGRVLAGAGPQGKAGAGWVALARYLADVTNGIHQCQASSVEGG